MKKLLFTLGLLASVYATQALSADYIHDYMINDDKLVLYVVNDSSSTMDTYYFTDHSKAVNRSVLDIVRTATSEDVPVQIVTDNSTVTAIGLVSPMMTELQEPNTNQTASTTTAPTTTPSTTIGDSSGSTIRWF